MHLTKPTTSSAGYGQRFIPRPSVLTAMGEGVPWVEKMKAYNDYTGNKGKMPPPVMFGQVIMPTRAMYRGPGDPETRARKLMPPNVRLDASKPPVATFNRSQVRVAPRNLINFLEIFCNGYI